MSRQRAVQISWARKINSQIQALKDLGSLRTNEISDGYHTFEDLYYQRVILFAALVNLHPEKSWKSLLHHDDEMFDGMFIVGIDTPAGQYTYHYNSEYWDIFNCVVLPTAPVFDGHTSDNVDRVLSLAMVGDHNYDA